jgi:predicted kinase
MPLKNSFQLDDIAEIAAKLIDPGPGLELALILVAGRPGVGKTTLAREFARQTNSIHFEIDDVKRQVVPEEVAAKSIDPPEYRYKYYTEAIRRLPHLFAQSPAQLVVIDETFHLQVFRHLWQESAQELNIQVHWIEAICNEEIVKQRLLRGKNRENHILGDKTHHMYLLFKQAFEPMAESREVVDTGQDIVPQVQRIISKLEIG